MFRQHRYIGTHDSAFVGDLDDPRVNQVLSVSEQLNRGVRFLQSQTHVSAFDELSMCHTSCWLKYSGTVKEYLSTVKAWMDDNPHAVITLLLTNGDGVDVSKFDDAFKGSGLDKYVFTPSTNPDPLSMDDWPTLGEMITSNQRLVVFLDYGAKVQQVPYILDEFHYFFETPYGVTDPTFNQCKLDRPPNASPDGRMYIVNHFLDKEVWDMDILVPDNDANFQTNAASGEGSIGAQVELCTQTYGRKPNFVLLDMFNRGKAFEAQQDINFG